MSVFDDLYGMQVAAVAAAAGFTGEHLTTAVAVAKGESGWRSDRVNSSAGETPKGQTTPCASYGLWQINNCPDRDAGNAVRGGSNPKVLLDPLTNARSAFAISSSGSNWSPWTVWRTGKHTPHLEAARKAVNALNTDSGRNLLEQAKAGQITSIGVTSGGGLSVGDVVGAIPSLPGQVLDNAGNVVSDAVGFATDWASALARLVSFVVNPTNWLRLLAALAGAGLVTTGLVLLALDLTGTADDAARIGAGAAIKGPAGAAMAAGSSKG